LSFFNITLSYLAVIFILISPLSVFACDGWPKSLDTNYTSICYSDEKGLQRFTRSIGKSASFFSESTEKNPSATRERVDLLVDRVSRLLDMYPLDLHFNIYVHQTHKDVGNSYVRLSTLGVYGRVPVAFYSHKNKAVYISIENISAGILAHEIAHAIINFYFPESPPERMQEILAQYVDKHLWEE